MRLFSRKPRDERARLTGMVERWRYFDTVELDQTHLERKLSDFAAEVEEQSAAARELIEAAGRQGTAADVDFLLEILNLLPILPETGKSTRPDDPKFAWEQAEPELGSIARVANAIRVKVQQEIRRAWQKNLTTLEKRVAFLAEQAARNPKPETATELEKARADLEGTRQAERKELGTVDQRFQGYLSRLFRLTGLSEAALSALAGVQTEEGRDEIRYSLRNEDQAYRNLALKVLRRQNWRPETLEQKLDFLIPQVKTQGIDGDASKELVKLIRSLTDPVELINVVEPRLAEEGLTELQSEVLEQLCGLHSEKALDRLAAVMASSHEPPALKVTIAQSLPDIGTPRAVQLLITAMDELDTEVRTAAAKALGRIAGVREQGSGIGERSAGVGGQEPGGGDEALRKSAMERLVFALRDGDISVREEAAKALKRYPDAVANLVVTLAEDRNPNAREYAALALREFEPAETSTKALLQAIRDDDAAVRLAAARALEGQKQVPVIGGQGPGVGGQGTPNPDFIQFLCARQNWKELRRVGEVAAGNLVALLRDRNEAIRFEVVELLGALRARSAVKGLTVSLSDSNQDVRKEAAVALRLINDASALDALRIALPKEGFKEVRAEIEQAIAKLETHNA
jgi:HEAT repeat protein